MQVRSIRVTAVGDSVMLGAAHELLRNVDDIQVNAAIKRQAKAAIAILREQRAAGQLGEVVVIHLGNNGVVRTRQFDELMQVLADVRLVVVVNSKTPRAWLAANNRVLAAGVQRYSNAVLVDWHAASAGRPELFWKDGIHLRPAGARFYASLIAAQIQASISGGAGGTDGTD